MATIYEKAQPYVRQMMDEVISQHHPDLEEVDISICLMMATAEKNENGEPISPALKLHGVECAAIVKLIPYKQRAAGREDAEITIDKDKWEESNDAQRAALMDHELTHLLVKRDAGNNVLSDDCGRPKLKMRPHDHDFGWFNEIAQRHGDASYEVKQAKAFADGFGQTYFGWIKPPDQSTESLPAAMPADVAKAMDDFESPSRRPVNDPDEPKNVTTADGRKITAGQMIGEIDAKFKRKRTA